MKVEVNLDQLRGEGHAHVVVFGKDSERPLVAVLFVSRASAAEGDEKTVTMTTKPGSDHVHDVLRAMFELSESLQLTRFTLPLKEIAVLPASISIELKPAEEPT